jgi:hypothetical protein
MARRPIWRLTSDGTRERDPLSAIGCFVARGSLDRMNSRDTWEPIRVRSDSHVPSVTRDSCDPITFPNMSRPTVMEETVGQQTDPRREPLRDPAPTVRTVSLTCSPWIHLSMESTVQVPDHRVLDLRDRQALLLSYLQRVVSTSTLLTLL